MADQAATRTDAQAAWDAVRRLAAAPGATAIRARLDAEPDRFARLSRQGGGCCSTSRAPRSTSRRWMRCWRLPAPAASPPSATRWRVGRR